ncbi:TIGR00730 family Rossman fold protein [Pararhodobacter sp.]|uniref:LOG family protein n=1 Tax=Pararhodobacter sp. TaxID=2127056 RepID=UPI002FDE57AF
MPAFSASVCLFCGARAGHGPHLAEIARETGVMLAQENWRLVYGAGDIGLMGEVAKATQAAGGQAFGVIPQHLMRREVARHDLSTLVVTETMHERKKVMFTNSDAIVVLPGGAGTLDEFFEVLTWAQIGLHRKPVMLLDAQGFWQPLLALIDHVVEQSFAEASLRDLFTVVPDVPALADALRVRLIKG